jgi:hypothetical protein
VRLFSMGCQQGHFSSPPPFPRRKPLCPLRERHRRVRSSPWPAPPRLACDGKEQRANFAVRAGRKHALRPIRSAAHCVVLPSALVRHSTFIFSATNTPHSLDFHDPRVPDHRVCDLERWFVRRLQRLATADCATRPTCHPCHVPDEFPKRTAERSSQPFASWVTTMPGRWA